jgi:hypothetical protein
MQEQRCVFGRSGAMRQRALAPACSVRSAHARACTQQVHEYNYHSGEVHCERCGKTFRNRHTEIKHRDTCTAPAATALAPDQAFEVFERMTQLPGRDGMPAVPCADVARATRYAVRAPRVTSVSACALLRAFLTAVTLPGLRVRPSKPLKERTAFDYAHRAERQLRGLTEPNVLLAVWHADERIVHALTDDLCQRVEAVDAQLKAHVRAKSVAHVRNDVCALLAFVRFARAAAAYAGLSTGSDRAEEALQSLLDDTAPLLRTDSALRPVTEGDLGARRAPRASAPDMHI